MLKVYYQRSAPIQPKTNEICRKFAKNWQLPYGSGTRDAASARGPELVALLAAPPRLPRRKVRKGIHDGKMGWCFQAFPRRVPTSAPLQAKRNLTNVDLKINMFYGIHEKQPIAELCKMLKTHLRLYCFENPENTAKCIH